VEGSEAEERGEAGEVTGVSGQWSKT
jgi:hypothetical protein